uniref:Gnk2-homologous domain-containing protein n=1 Tax=Leersia perrieri TaxID=77586 RepID=A0A0D9WST3_9ORYZ
MIIVILLLFVGHDGPIVATADDYIWSLCGITSKYTVRSPYQSNLDLLSAALSRNASSSLLFAKGSVGVAPDTVYGVALCRGDFSSNASACGDCVADVFQQAQRTQCPLAKSVFIVFNTGCQLRFSDKDILNRTTATKTDANADIDASAMILMNTQNITQPMLPGWDAGNAESVGIITNIIKVLVLETAKAAVSNNSTSSSASAYYATGRMDMSATFPTLYSMAQCTPNLRPDDCWGCLQAITNLTTTYLAGRQGGRILDIWCNFRYETYTFYRGEPTRRIGSSGAVLPPPTPPPGDQHRRSRRSKVVVISTVVALVSSVCCAIFCFGLVRKYKKGKVSLQGNMNMPTDEALTWGIDASSSEFTLFDLSQVLDATNNFAEENMLGKGGFGPVYKGLFSDGSEIAVKRLASHSGQGFNEFRNEIQLIAKLQHTNLMSKEELH